MRLVIIIIMAKRTLKIVQAVLKLRNQGVSGILAAGVGLKPCSQYDVKTRMYRRSAKIDLVSILALLTVCLSN